MYLPELRDTLYSALAESLADDGFRRIKKGEGKLIRKFKGGFHEISFAIAEYYPLYRIALLVQIRLDSVANITCHFMDILPHFRPETSSAITTLRYFLDDPSIGINDDDIEVSSEEDVIDAISFMTPILKDKVVPLLDLCTDIRGLDKLLNPAIGPKFALSDNSYENCSADSLTVARLADNPNFENMATRCEQGLSGKNDEFAARDRRLIAFLRTYDLSNPPVIPEPMKVEMSAADWPAGQLVKHKIYGLGTVVRAQGRAERTVVRVDFGKKNGICNMAVGEGIYMGFGLALEKV